MKDNLIFLDFVMSSDGIKIDQEKVKAILEWPSLKTISEVQSFHGLAIFLQMICKELQHHSCTTYRLYKIKTICLDRRIIINFYNLEGETNKCTRLTLLNCSKFFEIDCDASSVGIGVVYLKKLNQSLFLLRSSEKPKRSG
ncbi:hypothetical protein WN944_019983 [Citrus x changshan-huyou]|uniref:Reverse transcriptase/retrotransposon-derived protein RNase H-like domain-containing protein n=1 Tax=Citrus x changshan-huyou TaxID=2935761 RepID=A0AAP0LX17_9ROSI